MPFEFGDDTLVKKADVSESSDLQNEAKENNDISALYDDYMDSQSKKMEYFDELTSKMDKTTLQKMKEQLINGNEELLKELGQNDFESDPDDEGHQKVLRY